MNLQNIITVGDPWQRLKFLLFSSPLEFRARTASDLMGSPLCHGRVAGSWFGMPPALTPMLPLTCLLQQERQGLLLSWQSRIREKYIPTWRPATTLSPLRSRLRGVMGPEALSFIRELGRHLEMETGEPRSLHFLLQRLSVAMQRGNAAAVLGTSRLDSHSAPD